MIHTQCYTYIIICLLAFRNRFKRVALRRRTRATKKNKKHENWVYETPVYTYGIYLRVFLICVYIEVCILLLCIFFYLVGPWLLAASFTHHHRSPRAMSVYVMCTNRQKQIIVHTLARAKYFGAAAVRYRTSSCRTFICTRTAYGAIII